MSAFIEGFSDELVKLSGVISSAAKGVAKHPLKTLGIAALLGFPAYAGYQGAKSALSKKDDGPIIAKPGRPSQAWGINYHRLIGSKNLSKLEEQRESRNFARYRERK